MNKQKILIMAVVVLVILNVTTLSLLWFSKPGKQHHRTMRKHSDVEHFLKRRLNLTDEQATKKIENILFIIVCRQGNSDIIYLTTILSDLFVGGDTIRKYSTILNFSNRFQICIF